MKIFWKSPPISDNFANSSDWSTGVVPGNNDIAMMTAAGSYSVDVANDQTVLGFATGIDTSVLILNNSTFTATEGTPVGANRGLVGLTDGSTLQIGGTFNNSGTISLNSTGDPTKVAIGIVGATLQGGGNVLMTDNSGNAISYAGSGQAPLFNVNNKIEGSGSIGSNLVLYNEKLGVIDAVGPNTPLDLVGTVYNSGFLEGSGAAGLSITGTVNNTATGVILANTLVDLQGATIMGGTLETNGTGSIVVNDGNSATLEGTIILDSIGNQVAPLTLNSTGDPTKLIISGSVTLQGAQGGRELVLSDNSDNLITGSSVLSSATLVNYDSIYGAGTIGGNNLSLNNKGEIQVFSNSNPLIIDTGQNVVTNSGTLAAWGSELFIDSPVNNSGNLQAWEGGTLFLSGTISGTGRATIQENSQIEFGAASSVPTLFASDSTGELVLDDAAQYTGTVSGFGKNTTQSIDLPNVNFSSASESYAPTSPNTNGILTVKDTSGDVAHIKFSGTYTLANFHLADDGNGGVLITDPPVAHTTSAFPAATGTDSAIASPSMPQLSQFVQAMASFGPELGFIGASPLASLQNEFGPLAFLAAASHH